MRAPQISMLWESVDPDATLSDRFGFPDTTAAAAWATHTLSDVWGVDIVGCERLVISDGNLLAWVTSADGRLIAKCSIRPSLFRRLADIAALVAWVQARGIPVAAPIPARDGQLQVEVDRRSIGVYPVIEGDLLDPDDPGQVAEAGHLLARLQAVLAAYPHPIEGNKPTPGAQLVHNDFRSANLLHDGRRITAVLDFEEVLYRHRVADLAKTSVLLATRYHNWAPTRPEVRAAFVEAYCELAPLTDPDRDELEAGVTATLKAMGWVPP